MAHTEYYEFLGVAAGDSDEDIKRAYRRLALKHHPDKKGDPATFRKLTEVYDVLRDPEKRRAYDKYGPSAGAGAGAGGGGGGGDGGGAGSRRATQCQPFPPGFSVEEVFGSMFGGFGGFHARTGHPGAASQAGAPSRSVKAKQIRHKVLLSLEELYTGKTIRIAFQRSIVCPKCDGKGGKDVSERPCVPCAGKGFVVSSSGSIFQSSVRCQGCDASGKTRKIGEPCPSCKATGMGTERVVLEPVVKPGDQPNMSYIFRGKGDYVRDTRTAGRYVAGDVVITTVQKPSATFTRKGQNLYTEIQISLKQALSGFSIKIKHLDGRTVQVSVPKGTVTAPGKVLSVKNEGIPMNKGTLFVTVKVDFPTQFSTSSIEMLDILPEL